METNEKKVFFHYMLGFILSLILTLTTYLLVVDHTFDSLHMGMVIGTLALIQTAVQLLFFLRMGEEQKPHWKLTVFLFMLLVLGIVIVGSLWIMYNLNYSLMPSMELYAP